MNRVYFALLFIPLVGVAAYGQESNIIKLIPTDDTYVVTDLENRPGNMQLRQLNTGDAGFIKIWYANNVTENHEQIFSVGYLKFDLSELDVDDIESAELKMKPFIIYIGGAARPIDILEVSDDTWKEYSITFMNRPTPEPISIDSTSISTPDRWYSWDVTDTIKKNAGSEASLVIVLKNIFPNTEEQVVFYSKEAEDPENGPHLEIVYAGMVDTDYTLPTIIGGVIAAVAGGSIVAALVLRNKRTNKVSAPAKQKVVSQVESKPQGKRSCKLCGKSLASDFKSCPYCGYRI